MRARSIEELEAGLDVIRDSPSDIGTLAMIVRRPAEDEREVLEVGELSEAEGLVGDAWSPKAAASTDDGSPNFDTQVAIINSRLVELVAQSRDRWPLAGDQLVIDMDLSSENLPAGTLLTIGEAVLEVTPQPHTGCQKFSSRYGADALRFVSTREGRSMRLRGMYARVRVPGTIRPGDEVRKGTRKGGGPS